MDEISIAYFVLSKIPFVLLLGMMLVTAVRLHGELSTRLAAVSDPVSGSRHGEAGRWVLVVAGYVLLCIFLAVGASREVLEALRAGVGPRRGLCAPQRRAGRSSHATQLRGQSDRATNQSPDGREIMEA